VAAATAEATAVVAAAGTVGEPASGDLEGVASSDFLVCLEGVAGVLPPRPRAGTGVVPRTEVLGVVTVLEGVAVVDFEGGDATGERVRDSDAAVGLLSRSDALEGAAFLGAVGAGDGAFRARARDAAVGA
jgi:hypothetical protein